MPQPQLQVIAANVTGSNLVHDLSLAQESYFWHDLVHPTLDTGPNFKYTASSTQFQCYKVNCTQESTGPSQKVANQKKFVLTPADLKHLKGTKEGPDMWEKGVKLKVKSIQL